MPGIKGFEKALTFTQILKEKHELGDMCSSSAAASPPARRLMTCCSTTASTPSSSSTQMTSLPLRRPALPIPPTCVTRWSTTRSPSTCTAPSPRSPTRAAPSRTSRPARPSSSECDNVVNGIGFVPTPVRRTHRLPQGQGQGDHLPRRRLRRYRQSPHRYLARLGRLHEDITGPRF